MVLSAAHNRLRNLSAAVNAAKRATRMLLRGVNQTFFVVFFAEKLYNLGLVLNKLMQVKRVTGGTIFRNNISILTPF